MMGRSFSLQPFPMAGPPRHLKIAGHIVRYPRALSVRYTLLGDPAELVIPPPAELPARRNELWKDTCFELFLAPADSPRYWEFNLSPAGHWNVYRFSAYRHGMREEPAFTSLPFRVRKGVSSLSHEFGLELSLELEIELDALLRPGQLLEAAVSAVMLHTDGEVTWWALTHPGQKADFHGRDSFIIRL